MTREEAILYLEHTSSDDFNLEEHQIQNRLNAIQFLLKENQELKSQLAGTTHCFDEEEHNKLKEEIINLSKEIDMWNSKYNDMFDENRMLKKQVAGKIEISENQQKEFINYINSYIKLLKDKHDLIEEGQKDILEEILQKYRSTIGGDDLSELIITQ